VYKGLVASWLLPPLTEHPTANMFLDVVTDTEAEVPFCLVPGLQVLPAWQRAAMLPRLDVWTQINSAFVDVTVTAVETGNWTGEV